MKIKKQSSLLIGVSSILFVPFTKIMAQVSDEFVKTAAGPNGANLNVNDATVAIPVVVGSVISVTLSFVGTIFFVFIIYSGLQWMTAGGEEEKITKAKTRIINSSVGLAITAAAYFVTWFISSLMTGAL